jgi:hypothetical protein
VSELPSKWFELEHEIEIISTTLVALSAPKSDEVPKELVGAVAGPGGAMEFPAGAEAANSGEEGGWRLVLAGEIYSGL